MERLQKIDKIESESLKEKNILFHVLREDKIHPFVSGNKYRKLKYNVLEAKKLEKRSLLTFGGAFSNHIASVATAGKLNNIETIGVIRGEELSVSVQDNPTLSFALSQGMKLHFISREDYKKKEDTLFINDLKQRFGDFYLLPEGGTNELAVKGCEEILTNLPENYEYVCVPVGTGGTIAGLIKASSINQEILGFSALNGTFQSSEIEKYTSKSNYKIIDTYNFGGYAKIDAQLIRFINNYKVQTNIPLDPIYTGKMMYGIYDLISRNYFTPNSRILAIHTGGLQGIEGMNIRLQKKGLPQITI
ncbi:1-aminocyclopropane-1-carboxylate deaminase/D-cysteine desulfhydrase [Patiriisocius hiemis]|uniref:Pyridoxal-phosphate dependent enzyme n=1 Tax=Patiriisocius hiemis TaxID=3075604 RepID=A0ABU2YCC3_9FLAO|nr:pyridoxal-phosphate dependent enzyme [Constantimarinum sp. W242]MDT0555833.1 pyridoxal-phosphate dependent enzyme [Constantimarinum sp. W242]